MSRKADQMNERIKALESRVTRLEGRRTFTVREVLDGMKTITQIRADEETGQE